MPTHNRPEVLEYAIHSVLAQTYDKFELLVVGDGCTDHTGDVVGSFNDTRIRWFDLPKAPGFGYANRNLALAEATGDLIAFLGHDNLYLLDHLERMAHLFDQNRQFRIAYSRPLWINDEGTIFPSYVNLKYPPIYRQFMTRRNVLPATTVVYRRDCHDEVGGWPEDQERNGDWHLWRKILDGHGPGVVGIVADPTCLHFRANWRDKQNWAPAPIPYLEKMHKSVQHWPAGLQLEIGPSTNVPQKPCWELMQQDPPRFAQQIRHGFRYLQDILAYNAGMDPNFTR
ncbi:glycosyltransferase family 2 protein [Roseovarius sp. 2305UL8-3]|uniref:glycosyltransferase family 2 protein n=1 Tax=Roseovarius conchicola TaxID=3121636 RepID=UPI003526C97A